MDLNKYEFEILEPSIENLTEYLLTDFTHSWMYMIYYTDEWHFDNIDKINLEDILEDLGGTGIKLLLIRERL